MTVDRYGMLYNLTDSPAANIVGASTLAVTSDRYLIINRQHNRNDVNNDCYVPSGSGSADFEDLFEQDKRRKTAASRKKRAYRAAKQNWKKARKDALSAVNKDPKYKKVFEKQEEAQIARREYRYYRSMKSTNATSAPFSPAPWNANWRRRAIFPPPVLRRRLSAAISAC